MALTEEFTCYETPYDTMVKIKHAIKLALFRVPAPEVDLAQDKLEPLVHILDIRDGQCRWPITHTHWCGRETDGGVYCKEHHERAKGKSYVDTTRSKDI